MAHLWEVVSVMLRGRALCEELVGISGVADLRGRMLEVTDLQSKSLAAMKGGIQMAIYPSVSMHQLVSDDNNGLTTSMSSSIGGDDDGSENERLRQYMSERCRGVPTLLHAIGLAYGGKGGGIGITP